MAQLNSALRLSAVTPSISPKGRWVAFATAEWSPLLLISSGWYPRKRLCYTLWGKGQDRACFAVCGLRHSDWLALSDSKL